MSLSHGNNITRNGLVLHYDMYNTGKSWKGPPTINLHASSNLANWTKATGITMSPNMYCSATKSSSAVLVSANGSSLSYIVSPGTQVISGKTYTKSIFAKFAGDVTKLIIETYDDNGSGGTAYLTTEFDVLAGVVLRSATGDTAKIQYYGDGWYRCSVTRTYSKTTGTAGTYIGVYGNGVGSMYLAAPQLEEMSYVTPFTETQRTGSQALFDLTGQNQLTLSSGIVFPNANEFSFIPTNYINAGNRSELFTADVTHEAWVRASVVDSWHGITSTLPSWGSGIGLQLGTAQNIAAMVSGTYLKTSWTPVANVWYHIVVTHRSSDDLAVLYVNGNIENTTTRAISYVTSPLYIGCFYTSPNLGFQGTISQVRIYNRALTTAEVRQNYEATRLRIGA